MFKSNFLLPKINFSHILSAFFLITTIAFSLTTPVFANSTTSNSTTPTNAEQSSTSTTNTDSTQQDTQAENSTEKTENANQTCQSTIQNIKNLCRQCEASIRNEITYQGKTLNCLGLVFPSTKNPAGNQYFIPEIKANCQNTDSLYCQDTAQPKLRLEVTNSEFFDVTNSQTGILANSNSSFLTANTEAGPILGPIYRIIDILVALISTLTVLAIVFGSFMLVTARGEDAQITRGKDIIKNSIVALIIVLTSYTLVRLTQALVFNLIN